MLSFVRFFAIASAAACLIGTSMYFYMTLHITRPAEAPNKRNYCKTWVWMILIGVEVDKEKLAVCIFGFGSYSKAGIQTYKLHC